MTKQLREMKRIYNQGDIQFKIDSTFGEKFKITFFTNSTESTLTKTQNDVVEAGEEKYIYLNWSELNNLGGGVLNYILQNITDNLKLDDGTYDRISSKTTDYYIVDNSESQKNYMTYIVFDTLQEYNDYTSNGTRLSSGVLYLVKENNGLFFLSNNFDGTLKVYKYFGGGGGGDTRVLEGVELSSVTGATGVFKTNKYIETVTIPNGITQISPGTFTGCSSLTDITIPNTVTSIHSSAFQDCTSLTNITIPDSVAFIDSAAFSGCTSLTNINIPDSVTSINSTTFKDCSSLTNIIIPDSVTSIGGSAFYKCSGLTNITIPASVTSIAWSVFNKCSSLTSVTIQATTPPTLGTNAFDDTNANLIIYVPAESVEAYKTATNWSAYADRIHAIS